MCRKLLTTLSVLSLILCLATAGLWVRSYWQCDILDNNVYYHFSGSGHLTFTRWDRLAPDRWRHYSGMHQNPVDDSFAVRWGYIKYVAFPHWSLAALFALLPTYSAFTFIRHRKQRWPGCCASCGYDLRASPERCPECGKIPTETSN